MVNKNYIYFLSTLSSFNSFALFAIICKFFADTTGLELITQISITTLFIFFLGLSSIIVEKYKLKFQTYLFSEFFLTLLILCTPLILNIFLASYHTSNASENLWIFFMLILIVPLGLFTGIELPIYINLLPKKENYLLFFNYSGSLIASVLIILSFSQNNDFMLLCLLIGCFNFMLLFFSYIKIYKGELQYFIAPLGVFTFIMFLTIQLPHIRPTLQKFSYLKAHISNFESIHTFFQLAKQGKPVENFPSSYQKIDIVTAKMFNPHSQDNRWGLYLNHKIQFFSDSEKIYHQTMSFYPIIYNSQVPKKILILGGGDLGLARELSQLKTINKENKITIVELDPKIIDMAKNGPYLNKVSQYNSIKDKVNIINTDAVSFLRKSKEKYDFILADFPFPASFELSKLYSKEFYLLINKALSKEGFFVLDFPFLVNNSLENKVSASILKNTLNAAGFEQQIIFGNSETFILNNKKNKENAQNYKLVTPLLSNMSLTNLVERTDFFIDHFNKSKKINSLFKPAMEFKVNQGR